MTLRDDLDISHGSAMYKFVTEEELNSAENLLPTGDHIVKFNLLAYRLLSERDAYREGWKKLVFLSFKITDMSLEKTVLFDIDAEARRLLCGDTARILTNGSSASAGMEGK